MSLFNRIPIRVRHVRLCFGVLLIVDTLFFLTIGGGVNTGIVLPAFLGMCFLIGPTIAWRVRRRIRPQTYVGLRRIIRIAVSLWLISFVVLGSLVFWNALPRAEKELDWLIVLGGGLRGETPRMSLVQRLNVAVRYLERHPQTRVIVSGGQGRGETISEAEAMRRFLEQRGIAAGRIVKEDRSSSTLENLLYSKALLEAEPSAHNSIGVLSSDFHLFRVQILARRVGLSVSVMRSPSLWYLLPNHALREYLAIIKSLVLDFP